MAETIVKCIHCASEKVVKHGKQANRTPRFNCQKCNKTFLGEYHKNGSKPKIWDLIIKMSLNGGNI